MYKHTKFLASTITPNPIEVSHWIDLNEDSTGGVIKTFDGKQWNKITSDGTVDDEGQLKVKVFDWSDVTDDDSSLKFQIKDSFSTDLYNYSTNGYLTFLTGFSDSNCPVQIYMHMSAGDKAKGFMLLLHQIDGALAISDNTSGTLFSPLIFDWSEDGTVSGLSVDLSGKQVPLFTNNANGEMDLKINNIYIQNSLMNNYYWCNNLRNKLIQKGVLNSEDIGELEYNQNIAS